MKKNSKKLTNENHKKNIKDKNNNKTKNKTKIINKSKNKTEIKAKLNNKTETKGRSNVKPKIEVKSNGKKEIQIHEKELWKGGTFVYPIPAVLVTSGTMENSNIITVAWTGIINTNPPMVYISVRPTRYSYNLILENKEFVINLTTENLAYITDWCGVKSGKDVDKFKEMKLTKQKANFVKAPLIAESPVSIECKVVEIKELGSHTMFMAEVLGINASKEYIDENGAFDISKCNLIAYSNGGYYSLGKKLGKFGFSVTKKSKNSNKKQK
jgi:flavin reductase (DIM6/NTAB) family NADH-FMN oxidoreductase RutF